MDQALRDFILSDKTKGMDAEAFFAYFILRASAKHIDGKIISEYCYPEVAKHMEIPPLSAPKALNVLCQNKWVIRTNQGYWLGNVSPLGEKYFITELGLAGVNTLKREIREAAQKPKAPPMKMKKSTLKKIVEQSPEEITPARQLLDFYRQCCTTFFPKKEDLLLIDWPVALKYFKRVYEYNDEDLVKARRQIRFVFQNWEQVTAQLKWKGLIDVSLFGTVKILKTIDRLRETKIQNRYDEEKSKDDPDIRIPAILQGGEDSSEALGDTTRTDSSVEL